MKNSHFRKLICLIGIIVFISVYVTFFSAWGERKDILSYITHTRKPYSQAFLTMYEMKVYCDQYLYSHCGTSPSVEEIIRNMEGFRLSDSQVNLKNKLYVLESVKTGGKYLYWPYNVKKAVKDGRYYIILACNVSLWPDYKGKYYPYSRGDKNNPYVVVYGYPEDPIPSISIGTVITPGIPPVPGCLVTFEGNPVQRLVIPKDVVGTIKAFYPDIQIPPEMIKDFSQEGSSDHATSPMLQQKK